MQTGVNSITLEKIQARSLTPDQLSLILHEEHAASSGTKTGYDYSWSDVLGEDIAGVSASFGPLQFHLLDFFEAELDGISFEYVPVIVDGRMLRRSSAGDPGGVLYLMRRLDGENGSPGAWRTAYLSTGWNLAQLSAFRATRTAFADLVSS